MTRVLPLLTQGLPAVLFAALALPGAAATFTNLDDDGDLVGSLRWAIGQANMHSNDGSDPVDTIEFDPGVFDVPRTITLLNGQLHLTDSSGPTVIAGPGEDLLTVSGNDASRVFLMDAPFTGTSINPMGATVDIRDLTIANGRSNLGGGIHNGGLLTLTRVTVTGNAAIVIPAASGAHAWGGGIYNYGTLTIDDGTVTGNTVRAESPSQFSKAYGGGIFNHEAGLVALHNSVVTGNRAEALSPDGLPESHGGGIANEGIATLDATSVTANVSDASGGSAGSVGRGGGITSGISLTIRNGCVISDNTATASASGSVDSYAFGGGLDAPSGMVTVTDSSIDANTAEVRDTTTGFVLGGGVFANVADFRGCSISGNTANAATSASGQGFGGGVIGTALTFLNCAINRNTASAASALGEPSLARGGGLYPFGGLNLLNSTMVGNRVTAGPVIGNCFGGAIFRAAGSVVIGNCTIAANAADSAGTDAGEARGGGIHGLCTMGNTILAGNTVSAVAAGPVLAGPNQEGTVTSQGHNLVGDASGVSGFGSDDLTGIDAIDVLLDANSDGLIGIDDLAHFGGPAGMLALQPGSSPAIDAGDDALIPIDPETLTPIATDQRGGGFPRLVSAAVDIGAFEASVLTLPDPGIHVFEGFVDDDFLKVANWASVGTPTPAAMAAGDTYIVAANATLAGVSIVEATLQIDPGVTLRVTPAGSVEQLGGSEVRVAATGVPSNAGSYTVHSTGPFDDPTALLCGGSGGFVNEAGASFVRTGGSFPNSYSSFDGRFTNHGSFTEDGSLNIVSASWVDGILINGAGGVAVLRTSASARFIIDNAGTMTVLKHLDDGNPTNAHTIRVTNSGTLDLPVGHSLQSENALLTNTASGTVNVKSVIRGLDNSGVINLTGETLFTEDDGGNGFINRASGRINQGSHKVAAHGSVAPTVSGLPRRAWHSKRSPRAGCIAIPRRYTS